MLSRGGSTTPSWLRAAWLFLLACRLPAARPASSSFSPSACFLLFAAVTARARRAPRYTTPTVAVIYSGTATVLRSTVARQ